IGGQPQCQVQSQMDPPRGCIAVKVPNHDIARLEHLRGNSTKMFIVAETLSCREDWLSLPVEQQGVRVTQVLAQRIHPGVDRGPIGRTGFSGHNPPDYGQSHAVRQNGARFAKLRRPPRGELLDLDVGDGEKLVANVALDGVLLFDVKPVRHRADGGCQNDEQGEKLIRNPRRRTGSHALTTKTIADPWGPGTSRAYRMPGPPGPYST